MTGSDPPQREARSDSASDYIPAPFPVHLVQLPANLQPLIEELAKNAHEQWAQQRTREGWTYGPNRDDIRRTHPCLLPYEHLPEAEKAYDRLMVDGTLRAIIHLGYEIVPDSQGPSSLGASGQEREIN
jgi:hypothetical protein